MTNLLSIIISLLVLLLIIFIKDIEGHKSRNTYRSTLYYKLTNFNRVLIIISILIFIVVTIIDYNINSYTRSWTSFITVVLNGLSVAILALPLSLSNLYKTIFNDEEELLDIKYVITNKYDRQKIYNFNKFENLSPLFCFHLSSEFNCSIFPTSYISKKPNVFGKLKMQ